MQLNQNKIGGTSYLEMGKKQIVELCKKFTCYNNPENEERRSLDAVLIDEEHPGGVIYNTLNRTSE